MAMLLICFDYFKRYYIYRYNMPVYHVVMTALRLLLLPMRGALNDASTVTSADRSVTLSGCRQWRPRD